MSISRFRHSTGQVAKPQSQFLNVSSSSAMWDGGNTVTCNEKFVAVPWQTFGGCAVFSHDGVGKVAPNPPIVLGQEGPIIDVRFDPFDSQKLFTASEDGTIFGWSIPAGGLEANVSNPVVMLKGHNKKCGILAFHPSANGVLGSAAVDRVINIWDVEKSTAVTTIHHLSDYATGFEWNLDGSLFCVSSRDRKLRILDSHDGSVVSSVESHSGARSQRCVWCKRKNMIMTFGWNDSQQRQIKLWDTRKMTSASQTVVLDQSSAAFMPVFDEDINLLFLGSKGENNVKCFELMDDGLTFSFEVGTADSVKGLCMMPKWCLDVRRCEFDQLYQLTYHSLLTIDIVLPRKQANLEFQSDVFPPTFADQPAMTSEEFFNGEDAAPREYNLGALFDGKSPQPCEYVKKAAPLLPTKSMGDKHTVVPVHRKNEAFTAAQQKKNTFESSSSEVGDDTMQYDEVGAPRYVDPLSDMTQREIVHKETRMKEMVRKLCKFHEEIAALRKALAEKEAEMLGVLEEIQDL
ncbi:coronin (CRN12) [Leptomonas pyrrhocoris]|uniref:Coronin n=1 Tax=Leptomonas pyrrhocoris TaxID=157538 RepID=A0A0M9G6Z8_LEPPY|nr:coronin (CRN12) [Leptomonas pyrrhocoris]XP_015662319.1 coronin (CRN12) [Leptomonas pyrrhocoris]KPA83879.1 coronin (CRN12) [Leptomonas pyrrhocoris]KPA83880.1 coronin (CRN12) [Leptomonas pyrrhocoris]|eukprot:XP_015662318.1 coronin (CRN12) [Leptomonas pyrrhocoris]